MLKAFTGVMKGERGLTLLELTVVAAILAILAALTAAGVTGTTSGSRGAAKANDVGEVQKAVEGFSGEHPNGGFPTADSCLTDQMPDSVTGLCVSGSPTDQFTIDETQVGFDLDGDGSVSSSDTFKVRPIIWEASYLKDGKARKFVSDHLARFAKHAFERFDGTNYLIGLIANSDGMLVPATDITVLGIDDAPVWVLTCKSNCASADWDAGLKAQAIALNLIPEGRY
jgi:prepilin-type N-terminal cleavage/methylation domain-containing protein